MQLTPNHYLERWYEQRKRSVLLASLDRPYFHRVFEPGCAFGILTVELAKRSTSVLAADMDASALEYASKLGLSNADFERLSVPNQWPTGQFDLIVLSEFLYYLPLQDVLETAAKAKESLMPGGQVLACHWRHKIPESDLSVEQIHATVAEALDLPCRLLLVDDDFVLQSWSSAPLSIARLESTDDWNNNPRTQ